MTSRLFDPRPEAAELQTEGPTPSRVWGDQWLRVSEKVLKGLTSQLTNRIVALEALTASWTDDAAIPDPHVARSLGHEIKRLNELAALLRLLPAEPFVGTETVKLSEMIPNVLELHRHHVDLKGVPVEVTLGPDLSPVLVRPSALLRSLLVLLGSSAGTGLRAGAEPLVHIKCTTERTRIVIAIEGPAPAAQLLFSGDGSLVHAVRSALAHAHGWAEISAVPIAGSPFSTQRYEVTLPTLAEARRLEDSEHL